MNGTAGAGYMNKSSEFYNSHKFTRHRFTRGELEPFEEISYSELEKTTSGSAIIAEFGAHSI